MPKTGSPRFSWFGLASGYRHGTPRLRDGVCRYQNKCNLAWVGVTIGPRVKSPPLHHGVARLQRHFLFVKQQINPA